MRIKFNSISFNCTYAFLSIPKLCWYCEKSTAGYYIPVWFHYHLERFFENWGIVWNIFKTFQKYFLFHQKKILDKNIPKIILQFLEISIIKFNEIFFRLKGLICWTYFDNLLIIFQILWKYCNHICIFETLVCNISKLGALVLGHLMLEAFHTKFGNLFALKKLSKHNYTLTF